MIPAILEISCSISLCNLTLTKQINWAVHSWGIRVPDWFEDLRNPRATVILWILRAFCVHPSGHVFFFFFFPLTERRISINSFLRFFRYIASLTGTRVLQDSYSYYEPYVISHPNKDQHVLLLSLIPTFTSYKIRLSLLTLMYFPTSSGTCLTSSSVMLRTGVTTDIGWHGKRLSLGDIRS